MREGRLNLRFDSKSWFNIVGLACFWPCLQSSGFYPLSLVQTAGSADPVEIARYHLFYSVLLLALFAVGVLLRRKLGSVLAGRGLPIAAGLLGLLGHGALVVSSFGQTFPSAMLFAGAALVSMFVASFVLVWGVRMALGDANHAVLQIALSFLFSQLFLLVFYLIGLPYEPLFCVLSVATAACAVKGGGIAPRKDEGSFSSLRQLPLGMVIIAVLLIYFCTIYVRLRMSGFEGDSSIMRKLFGSAISVVVFAAVVLCLLKMDNVESGFVMVFALLVSGYLVGLCAIMLFSGNGEILARRVLIADEHCVEVFLWMILSYFATRRNLSATLLFGLYGIAVVALPWMLSFDVRYLVPAVNEAAGSEWVSSLVIGAMLCTAIASMGFLVHYALRVSREVTEQASLSQREVAERALSKAGLTQRELEVAAYVFRGYSAKRTAEALYLSEPTVKSYTSRVYRKLGVRSKQELIDYVNEHSVL